MLSTAESKRVVGENSSSAVEVGSETTNYHGLQFALALDVVVHVCNFLLLRHDYYKRQPETIVPPKREEGLLGFGQDVGGKRNATC